MIGRLLSRAFPARHDELSYLRVQIRCAQEEIAAAFVEREQLRRDLTQVRRRARIVEDTSGGDRARLVELIITLQDRQLAQHERELRRDERDQAAAKAGQRAAAEARKQAGFSTFHKGGSW